MFNKTITKKKKSHSITHNNAGRGKDEEGQGGVGLKSLNPSHLRPISPCDAGLKSCLISVPPPLWDRKNSRGAKRGGVG